MWHIKNSQVSFFLEKPEREITILATFLFLEILLGSFFRDFIFEKLFLEELGY